MREKAYWIFLLSFLFLASCMSIGKDFPTTPVSNIQVDKTSQREIFSYFGEPYRKGVDNGLETWTYTFNYWELGQLRNSRELYVVFGKDGVVKSYSFSAK